MSSHSVMRPRLAGIAALRANDMSFTPSGVCPENRLEAEKVPDQLGNLLPGGSTSMLRFQKTESGLMSEQGSHGQRRARGFAGAVVLMATGWVLVVGELAGQKLDEVNYAQGDAAAPVVVVELLDFGCSACANFALETFPGIRDRYVNTGQVHWQVVPFVLGAFRHSKEAARAAVCADEQGAFWQMHDLLFAQRGWSQSRNPTKPLAALAAELELDGEAFDSCYHSDEAKDRVERQTRAARRSRVRGTPTFLIDGEMVVGAPDAEQFNQLLDESLGR